MQLTQSSSHAAFGWQYTAFPTATSRTLYDQFTWPCSSGTCAGTTDVSTVGQHNKHEVDYNNQGGYWSSGYLSYYWNGGFIAQEAYQSGFTPSTANNTGDMNSFTAQMPGGYGNFETMTSVNVYSCSYSGCPYPGSGSWSAIDGSRAYNNGLWANVKVSSTELDVWDTDCQS